MGTIKQGILGGFSGRVGTVVGGTWKSVHYMRALAINIKDARTDKQLCQRGRFSEVVNFLKIITPFIRIGYRNYEQGKSAYNAATSYLLKYAVTGCGEEAALDFEKVRVSRGSLTPALDAAVAVESGKASFTWTDNSDTGDALATDQAMVLVYNKDRQEVVYNVAAGTRGDATAELTLPTGWDSEALAVYLGFCNEDGERVANSVCLKNDAVSTEPGGTDEGEDEGGGSMG